MKSFVILALICVVVQAFPQRGPPNNFNFTGLDALLGGERPRAFPQSNTGGSDSDNESRGKLACMKACIGPTKCPSRQEIKNETQEDRKECHDCIRASCGQLDPLDRRGVMKCVREAFENCSSCPPIPTRDRERVINCSSCLMQCRKHGRRGPGTSDRVRPTPFGGIGWGNTGVGPNMRPGYNMMMGGGRPVGGPLSAGKPTRRNKQSNVCRKTCSMLQYCPNMKEMKDKMQNVTKECKDCIVEECGDMATNKTEDASCIAEARQECVECPPLNDAEQMSKKKCLTCLKQCSANDNDNDEGDDENEEESREESPRDFRGMGSFSGGRGPGSLWGILQILARRNRLSFGGKGPFSGFPGGFGLMPGRVGFPTGGRMPELLGFLRQLVGGSGSIGSGRRGPPGGRGRRPGRFPERREFMHEMLKVITCARNEENCASCPTPKEARMRIINATFGCRKCVKEECGDTEAGNSTDKAECIRQARIDCLQCPPLTESEQMDKKKCAKCLMECAPKGGKPKTSGPRRGSFGPRPGPFGPWRGAFIPEHGILSAIGGAAEEIPVGFNAESENDGTDE